MRTRVVEFITSTGEGGAQSLVKDYIHYLDKTKFEVKVFCLYPMLNSGPGQLLKSSGASITSVYPRYSYFWSFINKLCGKWIVSTRFIRMIHTYKPDVIHAHLGVLHYILPALNNLPKKLFYTCHSEPKKTFRNHKELSAAKTLVSSANLQFIALHSKMQKELNSLFNVNNTQVVYNGIDINRFFCVDEDKSDIRRSLNIPTDSFVVGHVGRFIEAKNHVFLLSIFRAIKAIRVNAVLLLVGSGPLKEMVKKKTKEYGLQECVLFFEQRNDVERLLKAMDVFLFPSLYEGLPVSLIEAQAAGLFCVSSDRVTEEAFLTPKLRVLSLNQPIDDWVDSVLDEKTIGDYNSDIRTFEMSDTIKTLEQLYLQ